MALGSSEANTAVSFAEEETMHLSENAEVRPQHVSRQEWRCRVDCAAGHHLLDIYGLTDLVEGMVGVRVGGEPDAFLVKTYGELFDEVTASSLHKVRFDDQPDVGRGRTLNYASCNQIKYVLQAREDVNCVIHTHTNATAVVASLKGGLQPMSQHAFIVAEHIAYVDFDVEIDVSCMEKTVAALADKKILLMRNHGMMVVGSSVAEAFFLTRTLEVACQCQISAMQTGGEILLPAAGALEVAKIIHDYANHPDHVEVFNGTLQWEGLPRKLDRVSPSYKT